MLLDDEEHEKNKSTANHTQDLLKSANRQLFNLTIQKLNAAVKNKNLNAKLT